MNLRVNETTTTPATLSEFLRKELLARCKINPRYSLRAFARQLQIEPSYLSKILNGKRPVSASLHKKVSGILMLDSRTDATQNPPAEDYRPLSEDAFLVIANWYHYAILELAKTKGFRTDPRWVARKLGISAIEAKEAFHRLIALKLIEITSNGRLLKTPKSHTNIQHPFSNSAFRKLQKQILQQALEALDQIPYEERDQSSMTVAIDISRLDAAREKITVFRRELSAFLQPQKKDLDEVYQLSISLFPAKRVELSTENLEENS